MSYFEKTNSQIWLEKIGFVLLFIVFLVSFYSKAGVNFFSALAYLIALWLVVMHGNSLVFREPLLRILAIPLVVGFILSAFSYNTPWLSLVDYLNDFKFFLLPFVFAVFLSNQRRIGWLYIASILSAVIVIIYGFSQPEQRVFGMFHGYFIYPDVRTAQMVMIVLVASIVFVGDVSFRSKYPGITIILVLLIPVFLFALIMGSIRSTWLGFLLGLGFYTVFFNKKWIIPLIVVCISILPFLPGSEILEQLKTIVDFDYASNNTRLQLWRTGWEFFQQHPFFGVGENNLAERFLLFYNNHSISYRETYALVSNSIGDFHNSYLQILIERGVVTFSVFLIFGGIFFYTLFKKLKVVPAERSVYIHVFLTVSVAFLFSQFFHDELSSYSATLYFLLMYGAIYFASEELFGHDYPAS